MIHLITNSCFLKLAIASDDNFSFKLCVAKAPNTMAVNPKNAVILKFLFII